MNKKLTVVIILGIVIVGALIFASGGTGISGWLLSVSNGGKILFPVVTVSALLDSFQPCAFSVLLLTIAFLFSLGKLRSDILKIGGAYIFGIFFVYLLVGFGVIQALEAFSIPHFVAKIGAVVIIGFGFVSLMNAFFPSFPIKLRIPQSTHQKLAGLMEKASLPTAFLLGVLVGLYEFPCAGGAYLLVLGLLHDHATVLRGGAYLVYYNLIFVLPLVVILFIASNRLLLEKVQSWKKAETKAMRFWVGIIMIALGFIIFFF